MNKSVTKMKLEVQHLLRKYWLEEVKNIEVIKTFSSLTEADKQEFKEFVAKIDQAINIFGGNHETSIRH